MKWRYFIVIYFRKKKFMVANICLLTRYFPVWGRRILIWLNWHRYCRIIIHQSMGFQAHALSIHADTICKSNNYWMFFWSYFYLFLQSGSEIYVFLEILKAYVENSSNFFLNFNLSKTLTLSMFFPPYVDCSAQFTEHPLSPKIRQWRTVSEQHFWEINNGKNQYNWKFPNS